MTQCLSGIGHFNLEIDPHSPHSPPCTARAAVSMYCLESDSHRKGVVET